MTTDAPINWSRTIASGAAAGVVGGVAFSVFVFLASLLPVHASATTLWQFAASTAFGKTAFTSNAYVWDGVLLVFLAAIGWSIGYAYLARTRQAVNKQPIISGFVFGVVVYLIMQFVLFSVQALSVPSILSVYTGLLGATVFFGIPVAFAARVK